MEMSVTTSLKDQIFLDRAPFVTNDNDGTLRIRKLDETLELLWGLRESIGVSRVSEIGSQDWLNATVFNAVRPNADDCNLTVSAGKGMSAHAALISVLGEAFERYWAELQHTACKVWKRAELEKIASDIPFLSYRDILRIRAADEVREQSVDWVSSVSLLTGRSAYVPVSLILLPRGGIRYERSADGIAAGNSLAEAALHGLLELIERDAMAFAHFCGNGYIIENDSLPEPFCEWQADLESRGINVVVVYAAGLAKVPCFEVILDDRRSCDPMMVCAGSGAHPLPEIALSRAFTEALQSRACVISGMREDLDKNYTKIQDQGYVRQRKRLRRYIDMLNRSTYAEVPSHPLLNTASGMLEQFCNELGALGHEVYLCPLTPLDLPIQVASVLATGLESITHGNRIVGPRLARALLNVRQHR